MTTFWERYLQGYNWKPCDPYNVRASQKRKQGICHALNLHYPSRDGSWVFGYDYICGRCGMYVGPWPQRKVDSVVSKINKMDVDDEQRGLALEKASRSAANSAGQ